MTSGNSPQALHQKELGQVERNFSTHQLERPNRIVYKSKLKLKLVQVIEEMIHLEIDSTRIYGSFSLHIEYESKV